MAYHIAGSLLIAVLFVDLTVILKNESFTIIRAYIAILQIYIFQKN